MNKVIELTNKYIIIATPLLLFLFFLSIYFYVIIRNGQSALILLGFILMFCMLTAFTAGWGNMLKSVVSEDSSDEPYMIIKNFVSGVGEYFLPSLGFFTIVLLINSSFLALTYFAGMHFIDEFGYKSFARCKEIKNAFKIENLHYILEFYLHFVDKFDK